MTNIRLMLFFFIVTACGLSFSKPNQELDLNKQKKQDHLEKPTTHRAIKNNLGITNGAIPPFAEEADTKLFHYPYLQSTAPRVGLLIDPSDLTQADYIFGLTYMFPEIDPPHWEVGFDFSSSSIAFLHLGKRFIINERDYFRPYYKIGLTTVIDSNYKLASFVDYKTYQLRLSLGLEDVLTIPMSIRIETELSIGANSTWLFLNFGYSWGW